MAEDVPVCVKGDPLSLRQVLVNLVGNAIKFTHRGAVTVRVRPAEPGTRGGDDRLGVYFEVEDTGIGIPEEFLDTIFQSFSQTTRAFGGTGLGLAICKRLIGLMGGDIRVKSLVGSGSVFSFTAWFGQGVYCPVQERRSPDMPDAPTRPVRLLVAEDNDVNVMVTTLRLEEMGYTYAVAHTGLEVLDMLKRDPFDLVLMDIEMPVLDGISATKAIRSSTPGGAIPDPNIPIVGVTAHALKEFRDKSLDAGMDDYVSKPVNFQELARIIARLVGSGPPPSEEETADAPTVAPEAGQAAQDDPGAASGAGGIGDAAPWSPEQVREDLGVDQATFEGFLSTARQELAATAAELDMVLAAGDLESAAGLSRTIKSICASIGASAAALAAAQMHRRFLMGEPAAPDVFKAELERLLLLMDKS